MFRVNVYRSSSNTYLFRTRFSLTKFTWNSIVFMILVMDMNKALKYSYLACASKKVYAQYMTSIAYAL